MNGTGPFKDSRLPIRTMAALYKNYTHVVTLASSPIKTLKDLKGHVVGTGSPGSGAEIAAFRILQAYGIDPDKDIPRQRLGVAESTDALKDGKVDAFFWTGGLPTASIIDLGHTSRNHDSIAFQRRGVTGVRMTYGNSLYFKGLLPKTLPRPRGRYRSHQYYQLPRGPRRYG